MRHAWLLGTALVLSAAIHAGCGGDGAAAATTGGGGGDACGLQPIPNAEYCAADPATPDCASVSDVYTLSACGVPLRQPTAELARSENVQEYAGSGPPDLGCFLPSGYPAPPGVSKNVTIKGFARVFSAGCNSKDLNIAVYKVKRTGGEDDGELGAAVGTAIPTAADCAVAQGTETTEVEKCPGGLFECAFEYADVPTETELVIKTDGMFWAPLYEYAVYISNEDAAGDVWDHDVRALAQDDYTLIPQAAFGGTVTATHGVIAGEVHDCANVRLMNAVADTDVDKVITTYFTDVEDEPLPDPSRTGTNSLGLYACMDIKAGPVTVAAAGLVNGGLVSIGFYRARIFPDSVTAVTFRGLRPFQIPQAQ